MSSNSAVVAGAGTVAVAVAVAAAAVVVAVEFVQYGDEKPDHD